MSTSPQEPAGNALETLWGFESVLEDRDDSREVAEGLLTAAHAEAERILAAARAAGERTGESRRAAMLSAARAEATARALTSTLPKPPARMKNMGCG